MSDLLPMLSMTLLGHACASLTQSLLHRWLGHTAAGGALSRIHRSSHHAVYTPARMVSKRYDDGESSLTALYVVPAATLAGFFLWLLPFPLAACLALGITASFAAHVYVHEQYHLSESKLRRYSWFRGRRLLHAIHHRDGTKNFGLIDFFWDRLFGTFQPPNRPRAS